MKILFSVIVLLAVMLRGAEIPPIAVASPAEQWQTTSEGGAHLPAASRVEELFNTVGAVVVRTKAGQWDSGAVHATFTALEISHAGLNRTDRGLRIELSGPGTSAVVFVDQTVFPALHKVMTYYAAHIPKAEDCSPQNPSGGRLSWLFDPPRRVVHLLNTGVYFDTATGTPGFFLGRAFKTSNSSPDFRFPGILPSAFDKILDAAEASFSRPR